ncbi:MAG: response regulator [Chloroflexota bacterium]
MTTVLIIEDDDDVRNLMVMMLKSLDYEIITATTGPQGLQTVDTQRPDLIICDIMIPLLSGYEVYKRLSDAGVVPQTPFIFVSALDKGKDVRRGLLMGADDYLLKPFSRQELLDVVQGVLNRHQLVESVEETDKMANDIFVSYSHDDGAYMRQVYQALQAQGFRVWCDEEIEPSRDWAEALAEMITRSRCLVSILSPNAAQSTWVGRELGYAEANDTRIFPILMQGDVKEAIPLRLINHQFVDARDDVDTACERLSSVIRDYLEMTV